MISLSSARHIEVAGLRSKDPIDGYLNKRPILTYIIADPKPKTLPSCFWQSCEGLDSALTYQNLLFGRVPIKFQIRVHSKNLRR